MAMEAEFAILYHPRSTSNIFENPVETSWSIPKDSERDVNSWHYYSEKEYFVFILILVTVGVLLSLFLCMFFLKERWRSF